MSYYGLGTKEEILADLETKLSAISGIKFVDYQRVLFAGADIDKYPGIYINDIREDKEYLLSDIVRNTFSIALVGWVLASAREDLATKMNSFIEDVKDAIRTDPTRNSKAYDTKITSIQTDGGTRHPQGMFIIAIQVIFFSSE